MELKVVAPGLFQSPEPSPVKKEDGQSGGQGEIREVAPKKSSDPKQTPQASPKNAPDDKDGWTVLFYLNGNNWMGKMAVSTLRQLELVGSSNNMQMVAQVARKPGSLDGVFGHWSGVKRFEIPVTNERVTVGKMIKEILKSILPFSGTGGIKSPVKEDLGNNVDMASSDTLRDSIIWAMKKYPTKKFALVMMGPSEGIHGMMFNEKANGTYTRMMPADFKKALDEATKATGKKVDFLALDGSAVGNVEMAYQVKDSVGYIAGDQGILAGQGAPLMMLANEWKRANKDTVQDPLTMARFYTMTNSFSPAASAFASNVTAFDTSKLGKVKDTWVELTKTLMGSLNQFKQGQEAERDKFIDHVRDLIDDTQELGFTSNKRIYEGNRDAYHFAEKLTQDAKMPQDVKDAARATMTAIEDSVIGDGHPGKYYKNAHGMSIFMPLNYGHHQPDYFPIPKSFDPKLHYEKTDFAKDTNWNEFLDKISRSDPLDKSLEKTFGKEGAQKLYGVKRRFEPLVSSLSGWASFSGWWESFEAFRTGKPTSFLLLPPTVAAAAGVYGGMWDTYNSIKNAHTFATRFDDKSMAVVEGVDSVRGVMKSVACLSLLNPALHPVGAAAGITVFLWPWIKDVFNLWYNYKEIRDNVELSPMPNNEKFQWALLRTIGSKVKWDK